MIVRWLCEREQCEVSGWCPSLCCVLLWNGGGVRCAGPSQSSGVALVPLTPVQYSLVLRSCCVLLLAGCVRCVGECVSVLFVWWGILRPLPPRRGGGWGHCGWWGCGVVVGGMVDEGRVL